MADRAGIINVDTGGIVAIPNALVEVSPGVWKLQAAAPGYVEETRRIDTTAPLTGGGDLSANRTLAISAASALTAGSMSAADYSKLAAATASDTASTIVMRDASQVTAVGGLQIDTAPAVVQTDAVGKLIWNDTAGTLEFGAKGGNVVVQVGQELIIRVKNESGGDLTAGQVVYITGSTGANLIAALASASSEVTSDTTIGIVAEAIPNHNNGFVTIFGHVVGINTNHLVEGAQVWLSTVAGQTTATRPSAPDQAVLLGICLRKHLTQGVIFVRVDNGWELDELHDVLITTPAAGDVLVRNAGNTIWINQAQSALSVGYATTAGGAPPTGAASGDLTGTYPGPTLATIGSAATKGTAAKSATVTIDAKGRVTGISDQDIAIAESQVTNLTTDLGNRVLKAGDTMTGALALNGASATFQIDCGTISQLKFNNGASSLTPTLGVGNTGASGKYAALLAGTLGAGFYFDKAGTFAIVAQDKSAYTGNTLGTGTYTRMNISATGRVDVQMDTLDTPPGLGVSPPRGFGITPTAALGAVHGVFAAVQSSGAAWVQVQRIDGTATAYPLLLQPSGSVVGIGVASPTAVLHLKAGTATASTAPLKFTSGTLLTTPEAGAVEFLTDKAYLTITTGAARKEIALADSALTASQPTWTTTNGRLTTTPQSGWIDPVTTSSTPVTVPSTGGHVRVVGAAGAKAVNLPAGSGVTIGTKVTIKDSAGNAASGTITINANGTDTIDGAATTTITTNYGVVRLIMAAFSGGIYRWEIV